MHYDVTLDGTTRSVEIERVDETRVRIAIDGAPAREVELRRTRDGLHMLLDGQSFDAGLVKRDDGWDVNLLGGLYSTQVIDPRRKALRLAGGAGEGEMKSSMPGRVVSVLVEEGQQVSKGEPVLIIEAMKMENEVKAPVDGVVEAILVETGQALEAGAKLARIKPAE
ncbi:MAG: biotin/lipoyl-containing protein [Myxococcota bacterium]|nr:biotin/lipoyl-containing protein [Myxococcota bacterium]